MGSCFRPRTFLHRLSQCKGTVPLHCSGFALVEMLVALSLVALSMTLICGSFRNHNNIHQRMLTLLTTQAKSSQVWLTMKKDLGQLAPLSDYPFQGTAFEMSFPVKKKAASENNPLNQLFLVRYAFKSGRLVRSETKLINPKPRDKTVRAFTGAFQKAQFHYAYIDDEEIRFEDAWSRQPRANLPKTIRLQLDHSAEWLFYLPQGVWGRYDAAAHT